MYERKYVIGKCKLVLVLAVLTLVGVLTLMAAMRETRAMAYADSLRAVPEAPVPRAWLGPSDVLTETVYLPLVARNYGGQRYAVIVGIADYPGTGNDLNYTDDDAEDFRQMLLDNGNFEAENIRMRIDSAATEATIQSDITSWLASREYANDLVVFFFSGHGSRGGGHEYLVAYDDVIRDDELDTWLDTLDSTHVVVIADSCYSGGLIGALLLEDVRCKCLPPPPGMEGNTLGGDGFLKNVSQPGRLVLTASAVDEPSVEIGSPFNHGLFSYYLLEALGTSSADTNDSNGWVSGEESYDYLYTRVVGVYPAQHPQESDGITGEVDLTQP